MLYTALQDSTLPPSILSNWREWRDLHLFTLRYSHLVFQSHLHLSTLLHRHFLTLLYLHLFTVLYLHLFFQSRRHLSTPLYLHLVTLIHLILISSYSNQLPLKRQLRVTLLRLADIDTLVQSISFLSLPLGGDPLRHLPSTTHTLDNLLCG